MILDPTEMSNPITISIPTIESTDYCVIADKFTYSLSEITKQVLIGVNSSLLEEPYKAALMDDFEKILVRLGV